ncbi:trypsin-like cysteine/serine peptidase domain-containing protein [Dunaliella salina]|uniref:Trypsin-like cysteine/serine peptidase domain-containing protein n=1 Tax=Dunaliella salina TaxID=3046 RepID=A0ABQ7H9S7_DUNSA|nr:trypsin-like cysteine/serine peptidase domain-containing protein [Dunaliella salina]|eukprot:KAF5843609.1 trypsin-like cysteine/serine peptidase domain-containing protein [Dunaliella salina]
MMRSLVVGHSHTLLHSVHDKSLGVRRRSAQRRPSPSSACLQPICGRRVRVVLSASDSVNNTPATAINNTSALADSEQKPQQAAASESIPQQSSMLSSDNGLIDGGEDYVPRPNLFGPSMPSGAQHLQPIRPEVRQKSWALRSVIKVFSTKVEPNYGQPWQMLPQRSSTASAFVVSTEKRHLLTNAHAVSNATAVYVRRPGMARKFRAQIICEGKMCDLALMTVEDDAFWLGPGGSSNGTASGPGPLKPLNFVDVPELQVPIAVAGYPVGGDSLSVTKGIVSRLALVRYSPAARLLGIQIDAAINPGNSGGPAFADLETGSVAGVAFSKSTGNVDNIGYVIPWRVISHFYEEYEAIGSYRGVPSPGFATQDLENPAQKKYFKVPEGGSGVLVVRVDPLSDAAGAIKENDVLLEAEGFEVADDGTVEFREDERLEYGHVIRSQHVGDSLHLRLLRDGQELCVKYTLGLKDHLVPLVHGVDCSPSYYIMGGLVFCPLSSPFLEMVFGGASRRLRRSDIPVPVLSALNKDKVRRQQQVVVLVHVYHNFMKPTHYLQHSAPPRDWQL